MTTTVAASAHLLKESAKFMRHLASQNPDAAQQLEANAATYEKMSQLLELDPSGTLPDAAAKAMGIPT